MYLFSPSILGYTFVPRLCLGSLQRKHQPVLDHSFYATNTQNRSLFFLKPIPQGITGFGNFVFTLQFVEKEQYFGLLQAKPGKESNPFW